MVSLFIYPSSYLKKNEEGEFSNCSVTLIFCERLELEMAEVQGAIKSHYESNYQTEEIYIICGYYNRETVREVFVDKKEIAFKDIPRLHIDHLSDNLHLLVFDKNGTVTSDIRADVPEIHVLKQLFHDGLTAIFKMRGGLIEANGNAHHFVFPSGKHSIKFLRTGNILLFSSEIYFIAFHLLKFYKEDEHLKIFCDTSSINTIAFALLDLKRKLIGPNFNPVSIVSFSSYDGLFSNKIKFFQNSLILISSSTSGNIIEKLILHDERVNPANIAILYFLGSSTYYNRHKSNIICDLTKSEKNTKGIDFYDTYNENDCVYCRKGSYPVEIKGDVFLLEKPKIQNITFKISDAPNGLSRFVDQFRSANINERNIFKVNYKESSAANIKYEIYFDMLSVLSNLDNYNAYKTKLVDYINQYIPSNVKYLICLPDAGSLKLAEIILEKIKPNYLPEKLPEIKSFDAIPDDLTDLTIEGSTVIVASCISSGKNLLYLSRALRSYERLKLIYFIALTTTSDEDSRTILKSNLSQGKYGKDTHTIIEVENFYCNKDAKNTSWIREKDFLNEIIENFEDKDIGSFDVSLLKDRIAIIDDSMDNRQKGLANNLFYPKTNGGPLELRKGFAFWGFTNYAGQVSQADVYFTVSAIINNLRHSHSQERTLLQTEFVRNLIDPSNFHRYNDGVIQACILRSAYATEICYHIDDRLSSFMMSILEKIISEHTNQQGEGLIEFLYAIAIQKLTLKREHLKRISDLLGDVENDVVKIFKYFIDENILRQKVSLTEEIIALKKEIAKLKNIIEEKQAATS